MDKETLRMQMLAGVITEGQYKAKLEEIGVGAVLGGAAIAALAKKAYGAYKNYALKKGMKETGEEKKVQTVSSLKNICLKKMVKHIGVLLTKMTQEILAMKNQECSFLPQKKLIKY
jgi:hypothetical protein